LNIHLSIINRNSAVVVDNSADHLMKCLLAGRAHGE
jgi:hypothetical protein